MNIEIVKFDPQPDGSVNVHLAGDANGALDTSEARKFVFAKTKEAGYVGFGIKYGGIVIGPKVNGKCTAVYTLISSQWPAKSMRV
jgi:hypothetical protein